MKKMKKKRVFVEDDDHYFPDHRNYNNEELRRQGISTNEGLPSSLHFGFEFIFEAVLFEDSHGRQGRKKWERHWTQKMRG